MDVQQCVLRKTETKESLYSVKSGHANLIQYVNNFKNTALENHFVAIQGERETNTEDTPEVKIIDHFRKRCQKTCINDHEVKKLEHQQPKNQNLQHKLYFIILI